MPWTKGQSGNPSGRPKFKDDISIVARKYGPAGIEMLAAMAGLAPGERAETEASRVAAIKEILDRGYGKATQVLSGDEDHPLAIEFSWAPMHRETPAIAAPDDSDAADAASSEIEIVWDKMNEC